MTGPENSDTSTRPISVAELLAKNGTIGAAPPGGGRRRRRRGNSDAVTVAELTGEIPIVRTGEFPAVTEVDEPDQAEAQPDAEAEVESQPAPVDSRPASRPELADEPTARRGRATTPQRAHNPLPARTSDQDDTSRGTVRPGTAESAAKAEMMSPDPIVEESRDTDLTDDAALDTAGRDTAGRDPAGRDPDGRPDELGIGDASYLQSYLRATSGPLFGGQSVADDAARRGTDEADFLGAEDLEVAEALDDDLDDVDGGVSSPSGSSPSRSSLSDLERPSRGQLAVRGLLIAVQSIVAVIFGAGLFVAFDQIWKWNSIVALVLGVLVILGLVVGVRVVRKTEDIGSTLTAVALGALVTFGPLALLQAS